MPWLSTFHRDDLQSFGSAESIRVSNYLDAAKGQHLDFGYPWTVQLARAFKRAVRSAKRNLGPAKQAQPIPFVTLAAFKGAVSESPGAPKAPGRACLLASRWLLREIEASHSKLDHVKLDHSSLEVVFTLPNSKTDRLHGPCTTRSHSCSCSATGSAICPFHQIIKWRWQPVWKRTPVGCCSPRG